MKIVKIAETTLNEHKGNRNNWNKKLISREKPTIPFSFFLEAALKKEPKK
jgi:hypothetical protein